MQVINLQVSKSLYQHFVISVLAKLLNYVWLFEILMTVALQVPRSMGFPRQEYWSRLPFPSQEILVNPGMEPVSPALHVDFLPVCYLGSPQYRVYGQKKDTQKPN